MSEPSRIDPSRRSTDSSEMPTTTAPIRRSATRTGSARSRSPCPAFYHRGATGLPEPHRGPLDPGRHAGGSLDEPRAVEDPRRAIQDALVGVAAHGDTPAGDVQRGDLRLGPRLQQAAQLGVGASAQDGVADHDQRPEAHGQVEHRRHEQAPAERHRNR